MMQCAHHLCVVRSIRRPPHRNTWLYQPFILPVSDYTMTSNLDQFASVCSTLVFHEKASGMRCPSRISTADGHCEGASSPELDSSMILIACSAAMATTEVGGGRKLLVDALQYVVSPFPPFLLSYLVRRLEILKGSPLCLPPGKFLCLTQTL